MLCVHLEDKAFLALNLELFVHNLCFEKASLFTQLEIKWTSVTRDAMLISSAPKVFIFFDCIGIIPGCFLLMFDGTMILLLIKGDP
jgi:hypothetical protein